MNRTKLYLLAACCTALFSQTAYANTPKSLEGVVFDETNELTTNEAAEIRGTWQCTDYVKTLTNIAISGNAKDWYNNAKKGGGKFEVSKSKPKTKSIMVIDKWNETYGRYGHVAYVTTVEKTKGDEYKMKITHANWNKKDTGVPGNNETSNAIYNSKTGKVKIGNGTELKVNGFILKWRRK